MQIREDQVIRPDGKETTYYYRDREPFSILIPLEGNEVYLVQQYRYSVRSLSWEFPMGYVEGKNPYDTAVVELKEETGFSAGKLTEIGKFWVGVGGSNQYGYVYIAEDLIEGNATPEEGEFLELKKFKISEVDDMIKRGDILDGPTIVAYHYFKNFNKNI